MFIGLVAAALCCSAYYLIMVALSGATVTLNPNFTWDKFSKSFWWMLWSVLFEEFIYRGALLYIAIKKLGIKWGCILSASAFGMYHWFSYGAFGAPVQMAYIFVATGIAGWAFAYAFATTRSMYLPIALHMGWNLTTSVIFSQGPLGKQFYIIDNGRNVDVLISSLLFVYQIAVLPLVVWGYAKMRNSKIDADDDDVKFAKQ